MTAVHVTLGILILVLAVVLLLWTLFAKGESKARSIARRALVGLIDLQILIGIITFIMYPRWTLFVLHPILMIAAAGVAHTLTKESRPIKSQRTAYLVMLVLMVIAVYM